MKTIRHFCFVALTVIGAGVASGCVYYPARPYYHHAEYYSDGYTPYYTNYYARPYVGAVWVEGRYYRGRWIGPHWH